MDERGTDPQLFLTMILVFEVDPEKLGCYLESPWPFKNGVMTP